MKSIMANKRLIILIVLNLALILVLGVILSPMINERNQAEKFRQFAPGELAAGQSNIPALTLTVALSLTPEFTPTVPTRTPFPTPTRRATITPYPTAAAMAKLVAPTPNGSATQKQVDCSIYALTKATYQSNVNFYKGYYRPIISMYQKMVSQDTANNDPYGLAQDNFYLTANQNALASAIADQEKQYNSIVPEKCR